MYADINECKTSKNTCINEDHCRNTDGSHECFCPHGQSGNGTKEGGCQRRDVIAKVAIGKDLSIALIYFQFKLYSCVVCVCVYIYSSNVLVKIKLI